MVILEYDLLSFIVEFTILNVIYFKVIKKHNIKFVNSNLCITSLSHSYCKTFLTKLLLHVIPQGLQCKYSQEANDITLYGRSDGLK